MKTGYKARSDFDTKKRTPVKKNIPIPRQSQSTGKLRPNQVQNGDQGTLSVPSKQPNKNRTRSRVNRVRF